MAGSFKDPEGRALRIMKILDKGNFSEWKVRTILEGANYRVAPNGKAFFDSKSGRPFLVQLDTEFDAVNTISILELPKNLTFSECRRIAAYLNSSLQLKFTVLKSDDGKHYLYIRSMLPLFPMPDGFSPECLVFEAERVLATHASLATNFEEIVARALQSD